MGILKKRITQAQCGSMAVAPRAASRPNLQTLRAEPIAKERQARQVAARHFRHRFPGVELDLRRCTLENRVLSANLWRGSRRRAYALASASPCPPSSTCGHGATTMTDHVARHNSENLELAGLIKQNLRDAGKNVDKLTTTDLATAKVPADLDLASWAKRCD
jgi:hypothetical protein